MKCQIKQIAIENFKGIKSLTIWPEGKNLEVFGDNATGKTTIFDAFTWLLFGKDSDGRSDFEIKPVGVTAPECTVEAVLLIDGSELKLRRTYREMWVKKRGRADAEFSGHETLYFINDVPGIQEKAYKQRIADIIPEGMFQMLTDPIYFPERLEWKKRREILVQISGGVTVETVLREDPTLMCLADMLSDHSIDEIRLMTGAAIKKINADLTLIPARIDEAKRILSDTETGVPIPEKDCRSKVKEIDAKTQELRNAIASMKAANHVDSGKAALLNEIATKKVEMRSLQIGREFEIDKKMQACDRAMHEIQRLADKHEAYSLSLQAKKVVYEEQIKGLKAEWLEWKGKSFSGENTCPTCGQPLPADQIEKAVEAFNVAKATGMEKCLKQAESIKAEIDKTSIALEENAKSRAGIDEKLNAARDTKEALLAEKMRDTQTEKEKSLSAEIEQLQKKLSEIDQATTPKAVDTSKEEAEIQSLEGTRTEYVTMLDSIRSRKTAEKRVDELYTQQRTLSKQLEEQEAVFFAAEKYVTVKCRMLEDGINGRFKLAKFRLFREQVNGGIQDCCDVTYNGVPYGSLNNGARINVGLDIINLVSDHYGVHVPVFIDNRESITKLEPVDTQLISLIVSEADDRLRFEKVA